MLANLRRKIGMTTPGMQPDPPNPIDVSGVVYDANLAGMGAGVLDEMAFVWPADILLLPPTAYPHPCPDPAWDTRAPTLRPSSRFAFLVHMARLLNTWPVLVSQSLTDLGLPINGSDGVFLPFGPGWTGLGEMGMPEAW
ncbi:hypothetical protein FRC12_000251 [Ceratobasidium sp. 428]|nr:hypothetical protein FRC12_000251 [Ceratobasidium sp. 428]